MTEESHLEIIAGRPATENAWRRGFVDAWRTFAHPATAIPLVLLGAGAAVVSAIALGDVLGAVVSALGAPVVVALLVLAWALVRAPTRQRDDARHALREARGEIARLERELRPEEWLTPFDVKPMWYLDVEQHDGEETTRVVLLPIDFVNQSDRRIHLDFELVGRLKMGADRDLTSRVMPYRGRGSERFLQHSMAVEPQDRVDDALAWNGSFDVFLFEFDGGELAHDVTVRDDVDLVLVVTDRATGRTFEKPIPNHR